MLNFLRKKPGVKDGLELGLKGHRKIRWAADQQQRHLSVFGAPGTGKSILMRNLARQHAAMGGGLLCIDGNTDSGWLETLSANGSRFTDIAAVMSEGRNLEKEVGDLISTNAIGYGRMGGSNEPRWAELLLENLYAAVARYYTRLVDGLDQKKDFLIFLDGVLCNANAEKLGPLLELARVAHVGLVMSNQSLHSSVGWCMGGNSATIMQFRTLLQDDRSSWLRLLHERMPRSRFENDAFRELQEQQYDCVSLKTGDAYVLDQQPWKPVLVVTQAKSNN
jgi:hypothetical protein